MRIIIVGAGTIGKELARSLIADGHRITIVDNDEDYLREVANRLDCTIVRAGRRNYQVLEEAGLGSADALVCVAENDELNMITCAMAEAVYPDTLKIAMTCDPDYFQTFVRLARVVNTKPDAEIRQLLGIDWMVNPDAEMFKLLMRMAVPFRNCNTLRLGGGYSLVIPKLDASSPLVGRKISQLGEVRGWHYRIVCFYDDEKVVPSVPSEDFRLVAGGRIVILTRTDEVDAVASLCGVSKVEDLRVLVAGISPLVTLMMSEMFGRAKGMGSGDCILESWIGRVGPDITVVDESPDRCRELVECFPGIRVLCGDVTDAELVREEELDQFDSAISFTDNYDRNLVTSAFLKERGIPYTVATTANADVVRMARRLGVDVAISMRDAVVDCIRNHIYGRNVLFVEQIAGTLDIVCCTIGKRGKLPEGSLPMLVKGKAETEFHEIGDQTEFAIGDKVMILMPSGRLDSVRKAIG